MAASRAQVLKFISDHAFGVQASVSAERRPQAAVVGFVIADTFELFFDTTESTRKGANLRANARIAFAIGGLDGSECTVQYEGIADEPVGAELVAWQSLYFAKFPDGPQRSSWPGITYFRVRPLWLRFSNFAANPPDITEFSFDQPRSSAG